MATDSILAYMPIGCLYCLRDLLVFASTAVSFSQKWSYINTVSVKCIILTDVFHLIHVSSICFYLNQHVSKYIYQQTPKSPHVIRPFLISIKCGTEPLPNVYFPTLRWRPFLYFRRLQVRMGPKSPKTKP